MASFLHSQGILGDSTDLSHVTVASLHRYLLSFANYRTIRDEQYGSDSFTILGLALDSYCHIMLQCMSHQIGSHVSDAEQRPIVNNMFTSQWQTVTLAITRKCQQVRQEHMTTNLNSVVETEKSTCHMIPTTMVPAYNTCLF